MKEQAGPAGLWNEQESAQPSPEYGVEEPTYTIRKPRFYVVGILVALASLALAARLLWPSGAQLSVPLTRPAEVLPGLRVGVANLAEGLGNLARDPRRAVQEAMTAVAASPMAEKPTGGAGYERPGTKEAQTSGVEGPPNPPVNRGSGGPPPQGQPPSPSSSPTAQPSPTPKPSQTPKPTPKPTPTPTPSPSQTPSPTPTPSPSSTPTPTPSPTPSPSPSATATPQPSPSPSGSAAPSASPSPTPSAS